MSSLGSLNGGPNTLILGANVTAAALDSIMPIILLTLIWVSRNLVPAGDKAACTISGLTSANSFCLRAYSSHFLRIPSIFLTSFSFLSLNIFGSVFALIFSISINVFPCCTNRARSFIRRAFGSNSTSPLFSIIWITEPKLRWNSSPNVVIGIFLCLIHHDSFTPVANSTFIGFWGFKPNSKGSLFGWTSNTVSHVPFIFSAPIRVDPLGEILILTEYICHAGWISTITFSLPSISLMVFAKSFAAFLGVKPLDTSISMSCGVIPRSICALFAALP